MQLAPITAHLLPSLSVILPKSKMEIEAHVDQMMENKATLSVGPDIVSMVQNRSVSN
jgi:hypothetical protein